MWVVVDIRKIQSVLMLLVTIRKGWWRNSVTDSVACMAETPRYSTRVMGLGCWSFFPAFLSPELWCPAACMLTFTTGSQTLISIVIIRALMSTRTTAAHSRYSLHYTLLHHFMDTAVLLSSPFFVHFTTHHLCSTPNPLLSVHKRGAFSTQHYLVYTQVT